MSSTLLMPAAAVTLVKADASTVELDPDDGQVTIDTTAVPYAAATIEIPLEDASIIEQIDPTAGQRITVTASAKGHFLAAGYGAGGYGAGPYGVTVGVPAHWVTEDERTFDLALRSRDVDHKAKHVTLHAACDEALLMDYSPLADDLGAFAHMGSLRGVIDYVLGTVITGASLAAGTADADVTVYTDATNMFLDPGTAGTVGTLQFLPGNCTLDGNDASWSISGDGDSLNLFSPTSADSYVALGADNSWGLAPGKTYVLSATGNVKTAFTGSDLAADAADGAGRANRSRTRALTVNVVGTDGVAVVWHSTQVPNTVNTPTRVSIEFTVPTNATSWSLRAYLGNTAGQIRWDGFRLSEVNVAPTADNTDYFDGDTTDTAVYLYEWTSTQDASPSTRKNLTGRYPDSLIWQAGQTAWDFLQPLVTAAGLLLFCDEARTWRLVDPATYALPSRITVTPANSSEGIDTIDASDANVYCSGVVVIYTWTDQFGVAQRKVDSAGTAGKVYVVTLNAAYPGPGAAAAVLARRAGQGRSQSITALADWSATPAMEIAVSLPSTDAQVGRVKSVQWNLGGSQAGQMAVQTRGLVDTPAGSIDLLTGTIDDLTGTIDALT